MGTSTIDQGPAGATHSDFTQGKLPPVDSKGIFDQLLSDAQESLNNTFSFLAGLSRQINTILEHADEAALSRVIEAVCPRVGHSDYKVDDKYDRSKLAVYFEGEARFGIDRDDPGQVLVGQTMREILRAHAAELVNQGSPS